MNVVNNIKQFYLFAALKDVLEKRGYTITEARVGENSIGGIAVRG